MSKPINNQNLMLLHALHADNPFLKRLSEDWLEEISKKAHFFVFSNSTKLAQEKEETDYFGVILEGRVLISGKPQKKGPGFSIGELGYFGILPRHAVSIIGDSDGIVLAIRYEDFSTLSEPILKALTDYILGKCISILAGEEEAAEVMEAEQKKIAYLFLPTFKQLLNDQLDAKEKTNLLKYFPFRTFKSKDLILHKTSEPTLLAVIKGQVIAKEGTSNNITKAGHFYNSEGFLLNYSRNANVYCLADQAIVLCLPRQQVLQHLQGQTFFRLANFFLRHEINQNNYEIESYEKRKQKQSQSTQQKGQWSVFKKNYYEVLPLNIPGKTDGKKESKNPYRAKAKGGEPAFMGILFQEQLSQKTNVKTNTSNNSKMTKIISLKTEKNEKEQAASSERQIKALQKQIQHLNSKVKYYEQNFVKAKLEAVHCQAKLNMQAVFRQINEMGENRYKGQKGGEGVRVTTLKDAFLKQMRQNRIKEVVARCAYKWLWAVRRKKGAKSAFNGKKDI